MRRGTDLVSVRFYVLLALAAEPLHGLAIQEQIIGDTLGTYVRTSSLYAALATLERDEMIQEVGGGIGRQKHYQLTERGRRAVKLEVLTLRRAVGLAEQRLGRLEIR